MKPRFNSEINLGHLLQVLTMIGACIALFVTARVDRERLDSRVTQTELRGREHDERIARCEDTEKTLALTQVKLTTLIEERTARKQ